MKKAGIPLDFEVRGEMLMPIASFKKMNEERAKQELSQFANPRNATAGTVRQLEPSITAQRRTGLFCLHADCESQAKTGEGARRSTNLGYGRHGRPRPCNYYFPQPLANSERSRLRRLQSEPSPRSRDDFEKVCSSSMQWEEKRETLPYEIDGVVIKVNSTATAARARIHRQSPALGNRLQIRRPRRNHAD